MRRATGLGALGLLDWRRKRKSASREAEIKGRFGTAPTTGGDHFEKSRHSLRFKNSNLPTIGLSWVDMSLFKARTPSEKTGEGSVGYRNQRLVGRNGCG